MSTSSAGFSCVFFIPFHPIFRLALTLTLTFFLCGLDSMAEEVRHPAWRVVDLPEEGVKPSFDFDSEGRIHVMGMTEQNAGLVWRAVADNIDSPWITTTVSSGYFYGPGDLRVDPAGTAHIAFHDHTQQNAQHVVIPQDGSFTSHFVETPGSHDGWDNSLALDGDGNLYQTAVNPSAFGASESLGFGSFDGSSWTFQQAVPGSDSFMYGLNTSLAMDDEGQPHVLFCAAGDWAAPGNLRYATRQSGVWSITNVTTGTEPKGRFPSIGLGPAGKVHAAWLDVDPQDESRARIMYATLEPGGWMMEEVAELNDVLLGFSDARKSVSLVVDPAGLPHIAYCDQRVVCYGTREGGVWNSETILEDDALPYKGLVVLRLDAEGKPGMVFWQSEEGAQGLVRYVERSTASIPPLNFAIALSVSSPGLVELSWDSQADALYRVEKSLDLNTWSNLGEEEGTGARVNFLDALGDIDPAFYRLQLLE